MVINHKPGTCIASDGQCLPTNLDVFRKLAFSHGTPGGMNISRVGAAPGLFPCHRFPRCSNSSGMCSRLGTCGLPTTVALSRIPAFQRRAT